MLTCNLAHGELPSSSHPETVVLPVLRPLAALRSSRPSPLAAHCEFYTVTVPVISLTRGAA